MAKTYAEKLKDPRWQRKRLEALESTDFSCERCRSEKKTLHVHHRAYLAGKQPWEYEVAQLAVLCEDCHSALHAQPDRYAIAGSYLELFGKNSRPIAGELVAGFSGGEFIESTDHIPYHIGMLARSLHDSCVGKNIGKSLEIINAAIDDGVFDVLKAHAAQSGRCV